MKTIMIEVEPEITRAYRTYKPQSQKQFQALVSSIVKATIVK